MTHTSKPAKYGTANRAGAWANRSEEERLRCRATERRNGKLRQCTGDRRVPHEHEWSGKPFGPEHQVPAPGGPRLAPNPLKPH